MKKLILGLGLLFLICFKGFAGWYGGITPGSSPTLTGTWTFTGANTEFRNASYDVFGTTVSAGTKYFEFTPSSATFRNNVVVDDDLTLTSGGSITSTANGDITLTPNGTGDVNWTSQNSTMTTAGALTAGGLLTVPNITLGSQGTITGSQWAVIPSSSITNSTAELVMYSTTIPANLLGSNGCVRISGIIDMTNNANLKYLFSYLNAAQLGQQEYSGARSSGVNHLICNKAATNSQIANDIMHDNTGGSASDVGSIDTTANTTLEIRAQLGVATDTITWHHGFLEILK